MIVDFAPAVHFVTIPCPCHRHPRGSGGPFFAANLDACFRGNDEAGRFCPAEEFTSSSSAPNSITMSFRCDETETIGK